MEQLPLNVFFAQDFPDLFSWLLDQMGELPLLRKGRPKVVIGPLKLLGVSAWTGSSDPNYRL